VSSGRCEIYAYIIAVVFPVLSHPRLKILPHFVICLDARNGILISSIEVKTFFLISSVWRKSSSEGQVDLKVTVGVILKYKVCNLRHIVHLKCWNSNKKLNLISK